MDLDAITKGKGKGKWKGQQPQQWQTWTTWPQKEWQSPLVHLEADARPVRLRRHITRRLSAS